MAADNNDAGRFARDFGYLEKFLEGVNEHAATAPGEPGKRLRALLEGEAARWASVRALLEGRPGIDGAATGESAVDGPVVELSGTGNLVARESPDPVNTSSPPPKLRAEFTVGRLLADRRRS